MPIQAALGRVRRPLLGLAALALEGLEQDGLLAEHVGALDRPDRDRDVHRRAEDVEADEARLGRRSRWRDPRRAMAVVASERTAMIDLARTDGERGDGRALDDRERVVLEEELVRAGRRVRAVAVDHDVAARRVAFRPPAATWPRPGSRHRPGRATRTTRSSRSSRSPRSSRTTRRRPSNAPARTAASRSVGSAAPARSSRIAGQPLGVLRRFTIGSRLRLPAGRLARARQRCVEGGQVGRLGRPVAVDGGGLLAQRRAARTGGGCRTWPCRRSTRTRRRSSG